MRLPFIEIYNALHGVGKSHASDDSRQEPSDHIRLAVAIPIHSVAPLIEWANETLTGMRSYHENRVRGVLRWNLTY